MYVCIIWRINILNQIYTYIYSSRVCRKLRYHANRYCWYTNRPHLVNHVWGRRDLFWLHVKQGITWHVRVVWGSLRTSAWRVFPAAVAVQVDCQRPFKTGEISSWHMYCSLPRIDYRFIFRPANHKTVTPDNWRIYLIPHWQSYTRLSPCASLIHIKIV